MPGTRPVSSPRPAAGPAGRADRPLPEKVSVSHPMTPDTPAHARRDWRDDVGQGFRVGALATLVFELLFALAPLVPSMACSHRDTWWASPSG